MIGTIEIKCFAAKPQMPLPPVFAFAGSPSNLRILDVPRKIGEWNITTVKVAASYPDNSITVAEAVRTGNVWVATFAGCETSGKVANGLQIIADGTDENGDAVTGYVLGVGDLYILERDSTIAADDEKWYVRYCEEIPATPATGDLIIDNGSVKMYDGTEWIVISANLSAYATKEELNTAIQGVRQDIPTKTSQLTNDSGFVDTTTLNTALTTKQDKLSTAQVSAIDSVVDERKTVVTYTNGEVAAFDIEGELTNNSIANIEDVATVKIGKAVTSIGREAFEQCENLRGVTLPNSVTKIGAFAFSDCNRLTSVVIPDSVTDIEFSAFLNCSDLTSVTIGNGVTSIGDEAFADCQRITSVAIPDSVTSIGDYAFVSCSGLTSMTIGNGVTNIGDAVFLGCSGLTNLTFFGKTPTEVQNIENIEGDKFYPWGINTSIIRTENNATKEWVEADYVKAAVMTESEYAGITPQADTIYFVTEDPNA